MRRQSNWFLKFISHSFGAVGSCFHPDSVCRSMLWSVVCRKGWNVAILLSKSHIELPALQRNRSESSVLSRVQEFPPNAAAASGAGFGERTAPSRPVQAMVGKDS
jgi:hypothetical protein